MEANGAETGLPGKALSVNWEMYEALERMGRLLVMTARDAQDGLVGYAAFTLTQYPHYSHVNVAYQDVVYMSPRHRGFTAGRFLLWTDEELKRHGVGVVHRNSHMAASHERSLRRMGYMQHSVTYIKEL
jgi:hypothetical protein